jgi:hypothetical protein
MIGSSAVRPRIQVLANCECRVDSAGWTSHSVSASVNAVSGAVSSVRDLAAKGSGVRRRQGMNRSVFNWQFPGS